MNPCKTLHPIFMIKSFLYQSCVTFTKKTVLTEDGFFYFYCAWCIQSDICRKSCIRSAHWCAKRWKCSYEKDKIPTNIFEKAAYFTIWSVSRLLFRAAFSESVPQYRRRLRRAAFQNGWCWTPPYSRSPAFRGADQFLGIVNIFGADKTHHGIHQKWVVVVPMSKPTRKRISSCICFAFWKSKDSAPIGTESSLIACYSATGESDSVVFFLRWMIKRLHG